MIFTSAQKAAIETYSPRTIVLAGAGSGKTATLAARIAHLIQERSVDPRAIMAISFTRKASRQIRQRLIGLLGGDEAATKTVNQITTGTVHAVALRILQTYGDKLRYQRDRITILNPDDADLLLETVIDDLKYRNVKGAWRDGLSMRAILQYIERGNAGEPRGRETIGRASLDALTVIEREFKDRLFASNAMTFGLILTECRRLLETNDDVLDTLRRRFAHVIIDEIQDSNGIQIDFYFKLCPPASLFAVGDIRQSVYSFNYARPDIMESVAASDDTQVIDLADTFRCGDAIVEHANKLTACMGGNLARPMVGATGRTGKVECRVGGWESMPDMVLTERQRGYEWNQIAVLARSHRRLDAIESELARVNIPVHRAGSAFSACGGDDFKALHAIMRLSVNPRDYMAWLWYCRFRGFASLERIGIEDTAARNSKTPYEVAETILAGEPVALSGDAPLSDAMTAIAARHRNRFAIELNWWADRCPDMTLAEALEWYGLHQLQHDNQEDIESPDAVTLATIHSSKGLEWGCVIVACANEGDLPSKQSTNNDAALAEERRIFYVALTRAIERAVIHYRPGDDRKDRKPSRFIVESGIITEDVACLPT